jgi:sulfur-oxidizing protein SoxY
MIQLTRRKFVQHAALGGLACALMSKTALADWPSAIFDAEKKNDVLKQLFGDEKIEQSSLIEIKAPEIAENGAVVPVNVNTNLPNVESVSIIVDENPHPLAAQFVTQPGGNPNVGTRIKLAEKSNVTAIVKSNGKLYSQTKYVKVTKGGCGG